MSAPFAFHSELFGWRKADIVVDMGPMGLYQTFSAGAAAVGGMMNLMDPAQAPCWNYDFTVDSVDAAAVRVKEKGGAVLHGPSPAPGGSWILQGRDPEGALFALTSMGR